MILESASFHNIFKKTRPTSPVATSFAVVGVPGRPYSPVLFSVLIRASWYAAGGATCLVLPVCLSCYFATFINLGVSGFGFRVSHHEADTHVDQLKYLWTSPPPTGELSVIVSLFVCVVCCWGER